MNGDRLDSPITGFRPAASLGAVRKVAVAVEGEAVAAPSIWSVAELLLTLDGAYRSSAVSGAARAPFCMMGTCFDCLVTVDGRRDRQGCLVRLREGMTIERQRGGG